MARASIPTLLSLDRFAKIFHISPVHFAGATGQTVWPAQGACNRVWPQYAWQAQDVVSREEIAQAIAEAEASIAEVLGFPCAPSWISQDVQGNRLIKPDILRQGANTRGTARGIKARWGRVIQPGRRRLTLVEAGATVTYSDEDGDGFDETATIVITTPDPLADVRQIKIYFAGKDGRREWEIRPMRSRTIDDMAGETTILADSWLFIDPALWEAYPTVDGFSAIDVTTDANFVTTVDVYIEDTDATSQPTAQLLWANERVPSPTAWPLLCAACGGSGCDVCGLRVQNGCFAIRDANAGLLVPFAATYNEDDAVWRRDIVTECREPDMIKLWYQAGAISERYLAGETDDPLDDYWAEAIAFLAAARLPKKICDCSNLGIVFDELQRDLSAQPPSRTIFLGILAPPMITNPFGSRVGEYRAWLKVSTIFGGQVWTAASM